MNMIVAYSYGRPLRLFVDEWLPGRIIGKDGKIPWYNPEDLKLFRERTIGSTVIMGRKTWDSLPKRPLQGRNNIVVTSKPTDEPPISGEFQTRFVPSVEASIEVAKSIGKPVFVIGGATIYQQFLKKRLVDTVYASVIDAICDGDTYFPELGRGWKLVDTEHHQTFRVEVYKRGNNS